MAASNRQTVRIQADTRQLGALLHKFNQMSDEGKTELKQESVLISQWVAVAIKNVAGTHPYYPAQALLVADSVRATRDRLPSVTIGGSKRAPVTRSTASSPAPTVGQLLFGNEFGANRNTKGSAGNFPNGGYKFPERSRPEGRGNAGYWIFPTLREKQGEITSQWIQAVDRVLKKWGNQ